MRMEHCRKELSLKFKSTSCIRIPSHLLIYSFFCRVPRRTIIIYSHFYHVIPLLTATGFLKTLLYRSSRLSWNLRYGCSNCILRLQMSFHIQTYCRSLHGCFSKAKKDSPYLQRQSLYCTIVFANAWCIWFCIWV